MLDGELRYASVGESSVAYRVLEGRGDGDVVFFTSGNLPMQVMYDDPISARLLDGLRELGRLLLFDRRGVGQSDPVVDYEVPSVQRTVADLGAVIESADLSAPTVVAQGPGAAAATAASQAGTIGRLVLFEPYNPWALTGRQSEQFAEAAAANIEGEFDFLTALAPDRADDADFREWWDRGGQIGAAPAVARSNVSPMGEEELGRAREAFERLDVPTLLIRRRDAINPFNSQSEIREADTHIPATLRVVVPGRDHLMFGAGVEPILAAISEFVTGEVRLPALERTVQAVLFTDLGDSTRLAREMGDSRWKTVIDKHDDLCRQIVAGNHGRVVKTTGDGVLALLPSAAAALEAARAIRTALAERDLSVRAGVHLGDVETRDDDVSGLAVNAAARVMALAKPGEILATESTALAALGADIELTPHGRHTLKGLPGDWALYQT